MVCHWVGLRRSWGCRVPSLEPRRPPAERGGQTAFNFQLQTKGLRGPGRTAEVPPGDFLCRRGRDRRRREAGAALPLTAPLRPAACSPRVSSSTGLCVCPAGGRSVPTLRLCGGPLQVELFLAALPSVPGGRRAGKDRTMPSPTWGRVSG